MRNGGKKHIFDDWEIKEPQKVSCNECEHYYTNACDAPDRLECSSFKLYRTGTIDKQLSAIRFNILILDLLALLWLLIYTLK